MNQVQNKFVQYNDQRNSQLLYTPTKEVKDVSSQEIKDLIEQMKEVLKSNTGVGIAANQLGKNVQIFAIRYKAPENQASPLPKELSEDIPLQYFINPRITLKSDDLVYFWHGCLSALDMPLGKVATNKWIEYTAFNESGNQITGRLDGLSAIIFQHEFRHLLGGLYFEYAVDFKTPKELKESFSNGREKIYQIIMNPSGVKPILYNYELNEAISY
ncbi:peptide deformylase [Facilibium subflavum]|uniref:peptide deformylase n=1 Tax=Facilibium subflavum TaxID=2219058 RepID=UPI0013C30DC4|nr:peptide deformylase [Facilibium subflavum]